MKVTLNQISGINYYKSALRQKEQVPPQIPRKDLELKPANLTLANFPNVSFGMKPDMEFLLSFSDRLRCAYSGTPMIHPDYAKNIYSKLSRRVTAQEAVHYLQPLTKYMHNIEGIIFEMIKASSHKNKRNFRNILQEWQPDALKRLKRTQTEIINSANELINSISDEQTRNKVLDIKEQALNRIENDTFTRHFPIDRIMNVQSKGSDYQKIAQIYQRWYRLPNSHTDLDSFIVKYSKESHENIAKRLISSSVATIEHVKPSSRNGKDSLSNYILVSAAYNSIRSSMPLWEFIMLNPDMDIPKNLQNYIDEVIAEVHDKKSGFSHRSWYPDKIKHAIYKETKYRLKLLTKNLHLTKRQIRDNIYPERLALRYKLEKN